MYALLGLLALIAAPLVQATDEVHPIEIRPEQASVAWTVVLNDDAPSCTARASIGRMGERPLTSLFSVAPDGAVSPGEDGETSLAGLPAGPYDLRFESAGCWLIFSLVPG